MPITVVNVRDYGGRAAAERAGVIYVGRPTGLGNPFPLPKYIRAESVRMYRRWLFTQLQVGNAGVIAALESLRDGDRIGCFCKPLACHGDVVAAAWEWWRKR